MILTGEQIRDIRYPTAEQLQDAIAQIWGLDPDGFLILEDSEGQDGPYIQICYEEELGGFCLEVQTSLPRRQFRLKHPASQAEAERLFGLFLRRGLNEFDANLWDDVTEQIFGTSET